MDPRFEGWERPYKELRLNQLLKDIYRIKVYCPEVTLGQLFLYAVDSDTARLATIDDETLIEELYKKLYTKALEDLHGET